MEKQDFYFDHGEVIFNIDDLWLMKGTFPPGISQNRQDGPKRLKKGQTKRQDPNCVRDLNRLALKVFFKKSHPIHKLHGLSNFQYDCRLLLVIMSLKKDKLKDGVNDFGSVLYEKVLKQYPQKRRRFQLVKSFKDIASQLKFDQCDSWDDYYTKHQMITQHHQNILKQKAQLLQQSTQLQRLRRFCQQKGNFYEFIKAINAVFEQSDGV